MIFGSPHITEGSVPKCGNERWTNEVSKRAELVRGECSRLSQRAKPPNHGAKSAVWGSLKFITYLSCLLLLAACAWLRTGLPVRGSVGGQTIETRVDSEVAYYYLASYLAGKRGDAALDERIDRVYQSAHGGLPDRDELKHLSDDFSIDFAALYLADRIAHTPVNRRFRSAFDQAHAYTRKAFPEGRVRLPATAADYEVMFVPGYLYKRRITGADFAAPQAALLRVGLTRHFVETDENGTIETNANLVVTAIRARAHTGRRLIMVSVSKSGPEVALALTRLGPDKTRHVAAWVNIVGTLQGSPLADEGLWQELEDRIGQVGIAGVESLTTKQSRQRFQTFRIPQHVLVINYIGIPLTGSISSLARTGFLQLRNHGPNDGLSLLSDLITPGGGPTLAELGRDHFLLDEHIDVTTVALAITVIRWLENHDPKMSLPEKATFP